MHRTAALVESIVLVVLVGAGVAQLTGAARAQVPAPAQPPPTYNQDVARILFDHCVTCHRPGGIAPFSLLTFGQAQMFAEDIKTQVSERAMPPWYADPQYGTFKNSRGLTTAQIATLASWVDGGTPEGSGAPPAPPKLESSGWRMDRPPDEIVELPFGAFDLPARGEVPAFTVWLRPLRRERFVQAIEIRPSVPGAVHHSSLSLGAMPPGTRIGRGPVFPGGPVLDGAALFDDGRPFWSAGGEHIADKPLMFYVPGGGLLQFPNGLAKRFGREDYISWGLHLIANGSPEPVKVQVGLWYAKRYPHHEVKTWTVTESLTTDGGPVTKDRSGEPVFPEIPPGAANWAMTGALRITQDVTVHALWPHMHYRGKDMTFVVTHPDGRRETVLSVPHYNPHWQLTYELARPLRLRRGTIVTAYGHFDNSTANHHNPDPAARVKFGPQGTDEMFLPFLEVTVDAEDLSLMRFESEPRGP